ncbi:MAG TPA: right-handed parallel beta-helix repeat-containing protein, partial [Verrucomicrobiae bacterium]|nr:right-handed parallel beta-helix repeat-containing protein [Verrucomicrobiae bacterium]
MTFPGDSLILDSGTKLVAPASSVGTVDFPGTNGNPGLILNGGMLSNAHQPGSRTFVIAGWIAVLGTSTINHPWNPGGFIITAQLSGNGTLILLNGAYSEPLDVESTNNSYSGDWWLLRGGSLKGSGESSLGTGNIVVYPGSTLEIDYDIQTPGALTLLGANSVFILHQNCQFSAVTINGVSLAPGTYTYNNLLAQFPGNFAPGGSGSISIPAPAPVIVAPPPPPPPPTTPGYYVDYAGGSDANVGTNPATAWQHCPGDSAAMAIPAATTLKAGSVVWFKQGVTYVFTGGTRGAAWSPGIQCYWSGVTYASTNAWTTATGAGKAQLTDNYAQGYHYVAFWDYYGASNLTFDTLNIGPMGGSATLPADTGSAIGPNEGDGIVFDCTAVNILVKNCDFHDCGYSFNQKPMSAGSIVGAGIVVLNTGLSGMTVTNCTFGNSAGGLSIGYENAYSSGLKISSCTFTDGIMWGIDLHGEANACQLDNVTIDHNKFINWDVRFSTVNWTGYGEWPHCNAIFQRPGSQDDVSTGCNSSTNVNIHDNEVYDTEPGGSGTSGFWLATAGGNIYNNLFAISGSGTPALELSAGLQSHTNTLN